MKGEAILGMFVVLGLLSWLVVLIANAIDIAKKKGNNH